MSNNFLSINDWSSKEHKDFLSLTDRIKEGNFDSILKNKNFALVFEKASLRTRVSFEVAIKKLGGNAIYLSENDIGLGKRESVTHIAKNLNRWVDGIIARVYHHSTLINFTKNTNINIINALSDLEHPCQALADIYTIYKKFGKLKDINFCYVGDGNNVASSLSLICGHLGLNFTYSSPSKYQIPQVIFNQAKNLSQKKESVMTWEENPNLAVNNADIIYTDKWVSMGMEEEAEIRIMETREEKMETRKEKIDHMFALMNEVKILVGRLRPQGTGHIHTTINTLNGRVDEIKHELSKEDNNG